MSVPTPPYITNVEPGNESLLIYFIQTLDKGQSDIIHYKFSIDNGESFPFYSNDSIPFNITGLINGNTYKIIALSLNSYGYSSYSNMVEGTPTN